MNKLTEKIPDFAPDGPIDSKNKSLLSPVGDGVGQVLDKGLKPVGYVVGQAAHPAGEALSNVQTQAKVEKGYSDKIDHDKPDSELPGGERIGGKTQSGQNPLGL
ncbi:hypothetical protein LTR09_001630 [Extremus antarcticus]|uniref:Uncharacterized protein n=1 Tax=Extremus antarcticus TaxID=702011 RepID=A0AAJ0GH45_9PEZI|nr:hypothetical protein LTR09_001630 [Extremus antarcticus]